MRIIRDNNRITINVDINNSNISNNNNISQLNNMIKTIKVIKV